MSKWITDRTPTKDDCDKSTELVWMSGKHGAYLNYWHIVEKGEPWMPVTRPEQYIKPEPWSKVKWNEQHDCWMVHYPPNQYQTLLDFHDRYSKKQREAAERIGKIYEEIFEELRHWNG